MSNIFGHKGEILLLDWIALLGSLFFTVTTGKMSMKSDVINGFDFIRKIEGCIIGPLFDDRLKENILKPWKGAHTNYVGLSVCLYVRGL